LLSGLGLSPEKNPTRLHCANGVTVGHDGWLYLALGDNGVDVMGPEGDRLVLHGGGILRCRPDGSALHVYSTGLRNIYDIALDDQLNVFVRDNENDGGDYMIRVCQSFHGADHGYPYLYYEHPQEALRPLADLGRGSSAGGVCYLETAFPPEMRGNLFFCEWGRAVVRYDRQRAGSGFAAMKEVDFAAGATNDPYGFKPTDVIVDRDGSLLVSDWGDDQRPKRGRGRLYRIACAPKSGSPQNPVPAFNPKVPEEWIEQLNAPGYSARAAAQTSIEQSRLAGLEALRRALRAKRLGTPGRMHAVWILASVAGRECIEELFEMASKDVDPAVRAQAVRAIADLSDPLFLEKRLEASRGETATATRLARLVTKDSDPQLAIEVIVALGRLRWFDAPAWLRENLKESEGPLAHAAQQTMRRSGNWASVLKLLDERDDVPMRNIALRAVADRAESSVVEGLIERLRREVDSRRRSQYAEALARVYKRPGPWRYWGYRPAPRPANTETWEFSETIAQALDRALADSEPGVRMTALQQMQREQVPVRVAALDRWLREERNPTRVRALLDAAARQPADDVRELLAHVVRNESYAVDVRQKALATLIDRLNRSHESKLLELADEAADGPVLAELLSELGRRPDVESSVLLLRKLGATDAVVRAAALSSLAGLGVADAAVRVPALLADSQVEVRRAAAAAAGRLAVRQSVARLGELARDNDPATRSASLDSLRRLREPGAVAAAVAALEHPLTQLAALEYLEEFGGPEETGQLMAAASSSRSIEVLTSVVRTLASWENRASTDSPKRRELQSAVMKVQGDCGVLLHWYARGPLTPDESAQARESVASRTQTASDLPATAGWRAVMTTGAESRVDLSAADAPKAPALWLACSDVSIAEPTRAQFLASSNGTLRVWLNGRLVHERAKPGNYQSDSDRFEAQLDEGLNRFVVEVAGPQEAVQFHLRFRRLGSTAEHERIARFVLQNAGNAERGRELILNTEKTLCLTCHRLNDQGGAIGPDLTGVGSRFSRIHLIESILEPSRSIAPSYETITVALISGRVITGVKVAENDLRLTLGDDQGKVHEIALAEIDERKTQPRSTMPEGLEKRFSERDFLDIVTFLAAQRKPEPR
jgi:putative heme-binding domain-containing protein